MDRLRNAALLTRLIEGLCSKGDWCGETHVQKTAFFVQELLGCPPGISIHPVQARSVFVRFEG